MRYQELPYSDSLDELHSAGVLYYGMVNKDDGEWYRLHPHQLSPSVCHRDSAFRWRYAVLLEG